METQKIEVGDIFSTTERGTEDKIFVIVTDIICDGEPGSRVVNSMWGTKRYNSNGCSLKYKTSLDNGDTWKYEDGEGQYVDTGWIDEIIKEGHWVLEQKNIDDNFFDSLNESEDENEFQWAEDIFKETTVNIGDVFYVVDSTYANPTYDQYLINHKPENVRYIFFVNDIYEGDNGLMIEYKNCDREGVSYNPKDYNPTNPRCHYDDGDGYYDEVKYSTALELIYNKYWRPMGNNGYYNHLTESENKKSECVGINLSNITTEQKVSTLKKLEEIFGVFVGFSRYGWVDQIQYLITDFTTPVSPLSYRNKCGRWFNSTSDITYNEQTQEYYALVSMDGTKVNWSREIDGREFLNTPFIDDTSKLFESEDEFKWLGDLESEPFQNVLIKNNPRSLPNLSNDIDVIMFNPPVAVGNSRFNKIAYWLEDEDYYPKTLVDFGVKTSYIEITRHKDDRQNGIWEIGPQLTEQELYNLSQTPTYTYWNGNFWEEEVLQVI